MTILADMNSIFTNVLIVVHVAVCLLLCLVVLMQRPKQEGLGAAFGGGMTDQAFGARTTDVLQKGTVYLGTLLFIVTLALSVLVGAKSKSSGMDKATAENSEAQLADNLDILEAMPEEESAEGEAPAETPAETEEDAEPATPEAEVTPVPSPTEETTPEAEVTPVPTPAEEAAPEE